MSKTSDTSELNELQKAILDIMEDFHTFCDEHDLTYYLGGGSVLGAVRHQGIIPWDEDIDVDMPREDYERFLTLIDEFPEPFIVKHYTTDDDFIHPFIKIQNPNVLVETTYGNPEDPKHKVEGVWMDVFPLDGVFTNKTLRKAHLYLVRRMRTLFYLKTRGFRRPSNPEQQLRYTIKSIVKPAIYQGVRHIPTDLAFKMMDGLAKSKKFKASSWVGAFYSPYGLKATWPRSIYKQSELAQFNGHRFHIPHGYDYFLRRQYGDYMTPHAPGERRNHGLRFVNRASTPPDLTRP